ncbi:hypothetical protein BJ508DRAFT_201844, partial [Ascobolus immersus RN42]
LALMAFDCLSAPPMSDEPERVFSSAAMLITNRRNRLDTDVIDQTECLKSWQKDSDFE